MRIKWFAALYVQILQAIVHRYAPEITGLSFFLDIHQVPYETWQVSVHTAMSKPVPILFSVHGLKVLKTAWQSDSYRIQFFKLLACRCG